MISDLLVALAIIALVGAMDVEMDVKMDTSSASECESVDFMAGFSDAEEVGTDADDADADVADADVADAVADDADGVDFFQLLPPDDPDPSAMVPQPRRRAQQCRLHCVVV